MDKTDTNTLLYRLNNTNIDGFRNGRGRIYLLREHVQGIIMGTPDSELFEEDRCRCGYEMSDIEYFEAYRQRTISTIVNMVNNKLRVAGWYVEYDKELNLLKIDCLVNKKP